MDEAGNGEEGLVSFEVTNDTMRGLTLTATEESKDREGGSRLLTKYMNEHAYTFKVDTLQLIKLFEQDLNGADPFFIPGQAPVTKPQVVNEVNIYDNFIDSEALDDLETL